MSAFSEAQHKANTVFKDWVDTARFNTHVSLNDNTSSMKQGKGFCTWHADLDFGFAKTNFSHDYHVATFAGALFSFPKQATYVLEQLCLT